MTDAIEHRGPDGEGFFSDGEIALGHRRLKIIDLSELSRQPIRDAQNRAIVTFNGEIYNYKDLRDELRARGHEFLSTGDSETIPNAYAQWGMGFLEHLHGMFAFGLWDPALRRLVLARDRIGIKPLYIVRKPGFVAFASEIKAFLAAGLLEGTINRAAISEYVGAGYHAGGKSWYEEVIELPPGHAAVIGHGGDYRLEQYWQLPHPSAEIGDDPAPRVREALERSAQLHLQSDVPLGAHLSGGIDSSSVVALMARRVREPLRTFSVYFREGAWYDERRYIEAVSKRYETVHHYTVPTADDARERLYDIVRALDEPIAGPGVIPQYLLCADIRRNGVIVANGGQGGDEMFAGYERHLIRYAFATWHEGSSGMREAMLALRRMGFLGTLRHSVHLGISFGEFFLTREMRRLVRHARPSLRFDDILRQELTGYLPALLQVEDRTSMASSIESRVPLLDDQVIQLAATIHRRWKVRGGVSKRVLRDAVQDLLPAEVLARTDKRGLPTPFGIWIRGPLREYAQSIIEDPLFSQAGVFDVPMVRRVFDWHCQGRADFGNLLWRVITTGIWFDYLARAKTPAPRAVAVR